MTGSGTAAVEFVLSPRDSELPVGSGRRTGAPHELTSPGEQTPLAQSLLSCCPEPWFLHHNRQKLVRLSWSQPFGFRQAIQLLALVDCIDDRCCHRVVHKLDDVTVVLIVVEYVQRRQRETFQGQDRDPKQTG